VGALAARALLARRAVVRGVLGSANRSGVLVVLVFFFAFAMEFQCTVGCCRRYWFKAQPVIGFNFASRSGESSFDYATGVAKP
jgi:hypothetical protein